MLVPIEYQFDISFSNLDKEFKYGISIYEIFKTSTLYRAICCLYKQFNFRHVKVETSLNTYDGYCKMNVYRRKNDLPIFEERYYGALKSVKTLVYQYDIDFLDLDKRYDRSLDSDVQDVERHILYHFKIDEAKFYTLPVNVKITFDIDFYEISPEVLLGSNRFDGSADPSVVMKGYSFYSRDVPSKQIGSLEPFEYVYDLKEFPSDDIVVEAPKGVLWNKLIIRDKRTDVKAVPPIDGDILPKGFQYFDTQNGSVRTTRGQGVGFPRELKDRRKCLQSLMRMDLDKVLPELKKSFGIRSDLNIIEGLKHIDDPGVDMLRAPDFGAHSFKDCFKDFDLKGLLKTVTTSKNITKNGTYEYRNDLMSLSKTLKITVNTKSIPVPFHKMYWMHKTAGVWGKWSDFDLTWNTGSMVLSWPFSPPTLVPAQACVIMINDLMSSSYYIWVVRGVGFLTKIYPPGKQEDTMPIRYEGRYWLTILPDDDNSLNPYDLAFVLQPQWYDDKIMPDSSAKLRLLAIGHPTAFGKTLTWINNSYYKMIKTVKVDGSYEFLDKTYVEDEDDRRDTWPETGPWENTLDI